MNQFLSDAARIAASPRATARYLARVARLAVPALADFCLIYVLEGRSLRCAAAAHRTRTGERVLRAFNEVYRITRDDPASTVAQVVRSHRPSLRLDIRPEAALPAPPRSTEARVIDLHRRLAPCSVLVLPLETSSGVAGALALSYSVSGRRYKRADIPLASRIARQVALVIDANRLRARP